MRTTPPPGRGCQPVPLALPFPAAVARLLLDGLGARLLIATASTRPIARPPESRPGLVTADSAAGKATTGEEADGRDVESALGGDGDAFARIVARHQWPIAGYLRRFTADPTILEELVQETFVQAYLSIGRWRREGSLRSWLLAIATRTGYRYWRSRDRDRRRHDRLRDATRPEDSASNPGLVADVPPGPLESERDDRLLDLLDELSARDRLVLVLVHVDGRSVKETARLTGWSAAMVKVQAHRARRRLRQLLERAGIDGGEVER